MGTATGRAVIAAAVLGSGMAFLDGTVVNVALKTIGDRPRRELRRAPVGDQRLPALAGQPDPARRLARRPVRAPPGLRGRGRLVRGGLRAVRPGPQPRGADRGPRPPGRRRRTAHAGQPGDDPGRVRARRTGRPRSAPGPGWAASPRRSARSSAAVWSTTPSWRWIFLINLPLAAVTVFIAVRYVPETRDPHASCHFDWSGRRARLAGPRRDDVRPDRVGRDPGGRRGGRRGACGGRVRRRRGPRGASRCWRSASSATGPSRRPTR